ncbi:MAG: hypothetical protein HHJ15_16580 [Rhodoferax sp.]|uniref:hypothetical protein n=1 Tax=Rhodoferax sp. TaxID=50421 RepID=UPI00181F7C33|nr:hypothetical protein [Rhodoferax sp.]NMM21545.1 hypothetical protein [Rhodoferax sp.]
MRTIQTTFAPGITPWQFTPAKLKPVKLKPVKLKPVKLSPAKPKQPEREYLPMTVSAVARYVEDNGVSTASDISLALSGRISTICEILVCLERDCFTKRTLGKVTTRNAPVWFWESVRKYDAKPSRNTVIRKWIKTHPWRSSGQIGKSLGFENMSSSMRRLIVLGDVIERDMPNPNGRVIKHYASKGAK